MCGEFAEFSSRETSTPPRLILTVRRCSPSICDDSNACTADTCDAQAICQSAPAADGAACSDGNMCTGGDRCVAGACTPGTTNTCAPPPVVINEVESNGGTPGDWVELLNKGTTAVDVSGWVFKDADETHVATLPAGTSVPAGGYLVLDENVHFNFGLGAPESARLYLPGGTTAVDSYAWTAHAATTYARCPNGTGGFVTSGSSTRGAVNDCTVPLPPVVINEVESDGGTPGDWVELLNKGTTAVDVSGWVFTGIDPSTTLAVASNDELDNVSRLSQLTFPVTLPLVQTQPVLVPDPGQGGSRQRL